MAIKTKEKYFRASFNGGQLFKIVLHRNPAFDQDRIVQASVEVKVAYPNMIVSVTPDEILIHQEGTGAKTINGKVEFWVKRPMDVAGEYDNKWDATEFTLKCNRKRASMRLWHQSDSGTGAPDDIKDWPEYYLYLPQNSTEVHGFIVDY